MIKAVQSGSLMEESWMRLETEREEDGRWIAEVPDLPGVMVYGQSRQEAVAKAEALALRVIADQYVACPPTAAWPIAGR